MLDAVSEFIAYDIPWWVWTAPAVGALAAVFVGVSRVFGWRNALIATVALGAALLTAQSHQRGRQAGWMARGKKEKANAQDLVRRVNEARDSARTRAHLNPERLREDDGFRRD